MKGRNAEGLYAADGMWVFKYRAGDKWKTKSTGIPASIKTKGAAFAFKEDFLKSLSTLAVLPAQAVQPVKSSRPINPLQTRTLPVAGRWFLRFLRASNKSKSTVTGARFGLDRLTEVFGKNKVLSTFTLLDFDRYVVARRAKPSASTGEPVGPHLVNLELRTLRQILTKAALWKQIDPDDEYKPLPEPSEKVGQVLSEDQIKKLLALSDKADKWFVAFHGSLLAYSTGCRSIEIKTLKIKHVHLNAATPYIEIRRSKTKAGHRDIPLTAVAQWALRRLLDRAQLLGATDREHYLLPLNLSKCHHKNDPRKGRKGYDPTQHQAGWRSAWRSLKKAAGLPKDFRFHDLRCCFVTNLAEAAVGTPTMKVIVGHTSTKMLEHYEYIRDNAQVKAITALESHTGAVFQGLIAAV